MSTVWHNDGYQTKISGFLISNRTNSKQEKIRIPCRPWIIMNFSRILIFFTAQSLTYGCIVEDKTNHTMLHYVEKPQSYISPIINCGVYLFSLSIFELLATVFNQKQRDFYNNVSLDNIEAKEAMWLEKDILMPLAGNYCLNWWIFTCMSGSFHIRSVLIGVEYWKFCRILEVN